MEEGGGVEQVWEVEDAEADAEAEDEEKEEEETEEEEEQSAAEPTPDARGRLLKTAAGSDDTSPTAGSEASSKMSGT